MTTRNRDEVSEMSTKNVERADAPLLHPDHKRPVTRRDFLGQGLISGAAIIASPTLFGAFASREAYAQAAACGVVAGGAGMVPFIAFDLAGGLNIAGSNAVVGGPGGQMDFLPPDGYRQLGLPANLAPGRPGQVDTELGLAFHSDSPILAGLRSKTAASTRARINGVVICARSADDTGNNPHNPMYGINKAGANGDLVALVGTRNSESGGNSQSPQSMLDPAARPTKVDRPADARGLVDTGQLFSLLNANQAGSVVSAVQRLSDAKLAKVTEQAVVKDLIKCSYSQTTDLVARFGNPNVLDPTMDPLIVGQANSIFTAGELNQDRFRKTASIMKLVVDGFAGAGTVEQGGYDYHDGSRATGEIRDFAAGQMIGAAFEYAARRNQQLMVYVLSDGSVFSDGQIDDSQDGRGKGVWRGDRGSNGAVLMLVFNPASRPALTRPTANQIGHCRPTGDVETAATRVSNNVQQLAESIVLNYLALHDDVGRFAQVLPQHGLGMGADLDRLIAFQPIRSRVA
jgi:hypothetical protein